MIWTRSACILSFILFFAHIAAVSIKHLSKGNVHDGEFDEQKDISEINLAAGLDLFQGDIFLPNSRNGLRDPNTRWKFPIPYILADSLALNAKGAILYAFEMFRLKSCVDFKPYEGESSYIIFQKFNGCWSEVGNRHVGQNLSIGQGCDYKAIIEHEILHALGFYHEQSRMDRDDYVNIWWDEILPGYQHNFNIYDDKIVTDLNTPYDYESLMHYEPFSFNKSASVPTITAKIPEFNSIIGQRLDFSAIDLERLNRMYNCTTTHTLLDHCDFEKANICGMIQSTSNDADWVHEDSTQPGQADHTLVGQCTGAGYFMYFNTSLGIAEEAALLESRILYPKRKQQCLQFFYKTTGSPSDRLIVWVKRDDSTGNIRKLVKVKTFQGDFDQNWKIAHVTLREEKKFRYLFQGTKGDPQNSSGGIYLDDITLTETPCPAGVWTVRKFSQVLQNTVKGDKLQSPRFYNSEGYGLGLTLYPHGRTSSGSSGYLGLAFHLCSGENDAVLEWPVENRQVIMTILDQEPDVRKRMSSSMVFTTSKSQTSTAINGSVIWDRPSVMGSYDNSCACFRSIDWGWDAIISHQMLKRRSFLKNDDLIMFVDFEDITHLNQTEVRIKDSRLIPQSLVLQGQEQPASEEGSGKASLEKALLGSLDQGQRSRQKRSVDNTGPMEDHNWPQYFRDPCDPNPCQNEGICVNVKGMASCRCVSGHAFFYTGERCQAMQVHGSLLGLMIGGTASMVFLTFTIISILRQRVTRDFTQGHKAKTYWADHWKAESLAPERKLFPTTFTQPNRLSVNTNEQHNVFTLQTEAENSNNPSSKSAAASSRVICPLHAALQALIHGSTVALRFCQGAQGGASSNDHQVAIKPQEKLAGRWGGAGAWRPTVTHQPSWPSRQDCPDQDSCEQSASGHGKRSQFQKSSKGMYEFPRLIKTKRLLPPLLEVGTIWQDGGPRMVPIKISSQEGGARSHPWILGSGL
ncbi:meprin A subunit alpha [Eubalaena glacialis]|uniref:meprin A subunit alpha n=1 Tax=Eubalaena glacialis TaxID=27606 RepID=UPI002A59A678|nr:meprin A subunit alpha [Eubalaena glacialis]